MCGIVAIMSKTNHKLSLQQTTIFEQLFLSNQLRGVDGTGMFYDSQKNIKNLKMASDVHTFMQTKEYVKSMGEASATATFIVGHNRASTRGASVWKNTHPFVNKHITLVHNGTLLDHSELDKGEVVDSKAICNHLAANGYADTLSKIDGAFSLVWADAEKQTLNFSRNSQRPMHFIETHGSWIFSSELELATWILARNNVHVIRSFSPDIGKVYTFNIDSPGTFTETDVELFKPTWVNNWQSQFFGKAEKEKPIVWIPQTTTHTHKAFGEKIRFTPKKFARSQGAIPTAVLENRNRQVATTHYLFGLGESTDVIVKVYAPYKVLLALDQADYLEGTVTASVIRGQITTYSVENVTVVEKDHRHCTQCNRVILDTDLQESTKEDVGWLCPICTYYIQETWQMQGMH